MILVQSAHHSYRAVPVRGEQYDALIIYNAALAAHFDMCGSYDGAPAPAECVADVVADVLLPPMVVSEREAAEWATMAADSEQADLRYVDANGEVWHRHNLDMSADAHAALAVMARALGETDETEVIRRALVALHTLVHCTRDGSHISLTRDGNIIARLLF